MASTDGVGSTRRREGEDGNQPKQMTYRHFAPPLNILLDGRDVSAGQAYPLCQGAKLGGIFGVPFIWRRGLREIEAEGGYGAPVVNNGEYGLGPIRPHAGLTVQLFNVSM